MLLSDQTWQRYTSEGFLASDLFFVWISLEAVSIVIVRSRNVTEVRRSLKIHPSLPKPLSEALKIAHSASKPHQIPNMSSIHRFS
jgi:hypothetical protein